MLFRSKEAKVEEKATAERKLAEAAGKKGKAEVEAEVSADPAKKDTAAAEAEARAKEEEAAEKEVEAKEAEAEDVDEEVAQGVEIEEVTRASELPAADGERVTLVGVYMPRPQAGSTQMLGHVSVMIGGVEIRLGNDTRALSEILKYAGETIAVTGKLDLRKSGQVDPKKLEKPILTDFSAPSRR